MSLNSYTRSPEMFIASAPEMFMASAPGPKKFFGLKEEMFFFVYELFQI